MILLSPEQLVTAETAGLEKLRKEWRGSTKPSGRIITGYVHEAIAKAQAKRILDELDDDLWGTVERLRKEIEG